MGESGRAPSGRGSRAGTQRDTLLWLQNVADRTAADLSASERSKVRAITTEWGGDRHDGADGSFPDDLPLEANPALAAPLGRAQVLRIAGIAGLKGAAETAIAHRAAQPSALDEDALAALVKSRALKRGQAAELGLVVSLYRLLDHDLVLTEEVRERLRDLHDDLTADRLVELPAPTWEALLDGARMARAGSVDAAAYARVVTSRLEALQPAEALSARIAAADAEVQTSDLEAVDALAAGEHALDHESGAADVRRASAEKVDRFVYRHPGLDLRALIRDTRTPAAERLERARTRIALVNAVAERNPGVDLLDLDYAPGSEDLDELKFGRLREADRRRVLAELKARQRVYAFARDPSIGEQVLASGYGSATAVVGAGFETFRQDTGLAPDVARGVFGAARQLADATANALGVVPEATTEGFSSLSVANLSPEAGAFFRRIDGYEQLFGDQDACRCEHCASLMSPAAYFVDLMAFVESNVLDKVFTGPLENHPLDLRRRRPDLWKLELSCANTETKLPQLEIVDRLLEDDVARRSGFAGGLGDRAAVWAHVYKDHVAVEVGSFAQPLLVPLERVETYLERFGVTRGAVAAALRVDPDVAAAAVLRLSRAEWRLITEPNTDRAFLERVYGTALPFGAGGVFRLDDAQVLLRAVAAARHKLDHDGKRPITRENLGRLVATRYVNQDATSANPTVRIVGERRDLDKSTQVDVERVENLTAPRLDRLHRFTRLWRTLQWQVEALDLVVEQLRAAGLGGDLDAPALRRITQLVALQERFGLAVDEALALADRMPTLPAGPDASPLVDRLFNLPEFLRDAGRLPDDGVRFVHPALADAGAVGVPDRIADRLRAGLEVDAGRLLQLIVGLAAPLGIDLTPAAPVASRGFALSLANLSILYRHARVAALLRLSRAELFSLIAAVPGLPQPYIATVDELFAVLRVHDRLLRGGSSLAQQLARVAGLVGGGATDVRRNRAKELVGALLARVKAGDATTFPVTVFTALDGVSVADSKAVLDASTQAVVALGDGRYRLNDDFDPRAALSIPADGGKIDEAKARALLTEHHASEIVPEGLARVLGVGAAKAKALLALAEVDLQRPTPELARELRGETTPVTLEGVVETVLPLATLYAAAAFDADALRFVAAQRAEFGLASLPTVTAEAVERADIYRGLATGDAERGADASAVLAALAAGRALTADELSALARILDIERRVAASVLDAVTLPGGALAGLEHLVTCAELARRLGIDGRALTFIAAEDYAELDTAADAVLASIRASCRDEAQFQQVFAPFHARVLGRRRDGLADWLVYSSGGPFESRADLYRHFLIDVEVDGCFPTSSIAAAIGTVQLFVQRVLMNLEQSADGAVQVDPTLIPRGRWESRREYRVWEAGRKIFLHTERYLAPDLRDDKTPLFGRWPSGCCRRRWTSSRSWTPTASTSTASGSWRACRSRAPITTCRRSRTRTGRRTCCTCSARRPTTRPSTSIAPSRTRTSARRPGSASSGSRGGGWKCRSPPAACRLWCMRDACTSSGSRSRRRRKTRR
jgi:hypothetical protein